MSAKQLNPQQAQFAKLLASGLAKAEAYRQVYPGNYSAQSCATKANRLAKHPLICGVERRRAAAVVRAVDNAIERYGVTADRVADAMARLAFTDLRQIVDVRTVNGKQQITVRDWAIVDDNAHAAISEVRRAPNGEVTVRLYNKLEALNSLARLKGWIADRPVDQRQLIALKIER